MYQAYDQPVAYVVCLSSRPCALAVAWNSLTKSSLAYAGSLTSLPVRMMWMPAPVRPWSISGWKNWESEPQVPDMITIGFHDVSFSRLAIAWVQNTPEVSTSTTSALVADMVVNWLLRSGAVASWYSWSTTFRSVPLMKRLNPLT